MIRPSLRRPLPALAAAAIIVCTAAPPAGAQQEAQFVALDVNKDGVIDHAEFRAARVRDFRSIDANRDGYLSRTEFVERDAGGRYTLRSLRARRFVDMDKDGDNRASLQEYMAFGVVVFARVDQNGDGRVSREEFLNPRRAPPTKRADDDGAAPLPPGERGADGGSGSDPRRGAFTALDTNADGMITAAELDAARRKAFQQLDGDGDGKLQAAEAITQMGPRAARRFAELDTNKDGVVTLEEYLAAGRVLLIRSDVNRDGRITWQEFRATTPLR